MSLLAVQLRLVSRARDSRPPLEGLVETARPEALKRQPRLQPVRRVELLLLFVKYHMLI